MSADPSSPTTTAWPQATGNRPSLGEMHASVAVPSGGHWWFRLLAFLGPGYMVSVGYMDPGNWATDIAGGAQFGYLLLSVILLPLIEMVESSKAFTTPPFCDHTHTHWSARRCLH